MRPGCQRGRTGRSAEARRGALVLKEASGEPAGRSLSPLALDAGLSGAPAEVLKSLEGMTLLEARRRVKP